MGDMAAVEVILPVVDTRTANIVAHLLTMPRTQAASDNLATNTETGEVAATYNISSYK